jgi:CspA family cold shock protein
MPKGTIRRLIADRGFGFIKTERGEDLFFHRNQLQGVDYHSLVEGQEVEFEVGRGRNGRLQAVGVRLHIKPSQADLEKGGTGMVNSHDRAAKLIARKLGVKYRLQASPDVKGKHVRVEVKSSANEIPQALRQLAGGTGPAFIALPKSQRKKAMKRLAGLKTGLMNYQGKVVKPSTRK